MAVKRKEVDDLHRPPLDSSPSMATSPPGNLKKGDWQGAFSSTDIRNRPPGQDIERKPLNKWQKLEIKRRQEKEELS